MSPHEAGRELDALVAEQVFGVPLPPREDAPARYSSFTHHKSQLWFWHYGEDRWNPGPFSGDIRFAWKVVKHMRESAAPRFKNLSLVAYCYNRTYATFDAEAFAEYDAATWSEANGEHATPLAICLAALQAVAAALAPRGGAARP